MRNKLTVEITLNDIKRGKSSNPHKCPVALAMRRVIKAKHVIVGYTNIWWFYNNTWWRWDTSKKVKGIMAQYDSHKEIGPCNFTIYRSNVMSAINKACPWRVNNWRYSYE